MALRICDRAAKGKCNDPLCKHRVPHGIISFWCEETQLCTTSAGADKKSTCSVQCISTRLANDSKD